MLTKIFDGILWFIVILTHGPDMLRELDRGIEKYKGNNPYHIAIREYLRMEKWKIIRVPLSALIAVIACILMYHYIVYH